MEYWIIDESTDLLESYRRDLITREPGQPGDCPACAGEDLCAVHTQIALVDNALRGLREEAARRLMRAR